MIGRMSYDRKGGKNGIIFTDSNHSRTIKRYLVFWTEEMLNNYEKKAYEDDEFGQCDSWQMADFMRKLGYPFEYEW